MSLYCLKCGHSREMHVIENGEEKCPDPVREEKTTPPQEHNRSPRGDY